MATGSFRMLSRFWRPGVLPLMLAVLVVTGCSHKSRSWKEDVLLEDGTTIRIERRVKFVTNNSWSGDAYSATEAFASLEFPENLQVPPWQVPLRPLLLYRDDGQWVIVSTGTTCQVWMDRGRRRPPYWEYRLIGGAWREVLLSEKSPGQVPNLFFSYDKRPPALVDMKAKRARLRQIVRSDKYTSINPNPRNFGCN